MKLGELTDTSIQESESHIVIEMPNGTRMSTIDYYHDQNKRGEDIIVIRAGRKLD